MATPAQPTASNSNSIVVLVMFVAVTATAGVLYSVLEDSAPRQKLAYKPPADPPTSIPVPAVSPTVAPESKPPARQARKHAARPKGSGSPVAKQPPIVPQQRALSPDERIQAEVMSAIRRTGNLHGSISVEAKDGVVHLNGWTLTPGQAYRAANAARRVKDVKEVQSDIRPRMTGSV